MKQYFVLGLIGLMLLCTLQIQQRQLELADKLVRLHVIANSDTMEDQQMKLAVRDAVLEQVQCSTAACTDKSQTVRVLQSQLPVLEQTARQTLWELGCPMTVRVSLGPERYPTRYYDTFTLPAGQYTSLRVELGEADGRNWWCVAFPTLCTAAQQEDLQATAVACGFAPEEVAMITDSENYEIDFMVLEWLEKVRVLFEE